MLWHCQGPLRWHYSWCSVRPHPRLLDTERSCQMPGTIVTSARFGRPGCLRAGAGREVRASHCCWSTDWQEREKRRKRVPVVYASLLIAVDTYSCHHCIRRQALGLCRLFFNSSYLMWGVSALFRCSSLQHEVNKLEEMQREKATRSQMWFAYERMHVFSLLVDFNKCTVHSVSTQPGLIVKVMWVMVNIEFTCTSLCSNLNCSLVDGHICSDKKHLVLMFFFYSLHFIDGYIIKLDFKCIQIHTLIFP